MKKNNMEGSLDQIIKNSGHSTAEISWYTGINVEELDLCVAGMYELSQEQEVRVKAYFGI